jgi:hypothetical protein
MKLEIEPLKDDSAAASDTDDDSISIDGPPSDEPKMVCEVREYEERHNIKGEKIMKLVEDKVEVDKKEEGKEYAMISYKHYDSRGDLESSRIEIQSSHIIKALREVIKTYPGQSFSGDIVILHGMLKCIFHYREQLEAYRENQEDKVAKWHIHLLLRFMAKELKSSIRGYKAHVETSIDTPSIEFKDLWMVFIPGELILSGRDETRQISLLRSMNLVTDSGGQSWSVTVRCLTHDGAHFGYSDKIVSVPSFGGAKEIRMLATWPLRWLNDEAAVAKLKKELTTRGEKFVALKGYHHRTYTGMATFVTEEYEREDSGSITPCPPGCSQWKYRLDSTSVRGSFPKFVVR